MIVQLESLLAGTSRETEIEEDIKHTEKTIRDPDEPCEEDMEGTAGYSQIYADFA